MAAQSHGSPQAAHRPSGVRSDSRPQAGHTWSSQQAGSPPSGPAGPGSAGSTAQSSSGGANRASASIEGQV